MESQRRVPGVLTPPAIRSIRSIRKIGCCLSKSRIVRILRMGFRPRDRSGCLTQSFLRIMRILLSGSERTLMDLRRQRRVCVSSECVTQPASSVAREGQPRAPKRYIMSQRGNDLVRRYLWMVGLRAVAAAPRLTVECGSFPLLSLQVFLVLGRRQGLESDRLGADLARRDRAHQKAARLCHGCEIDNLVMAPPRCVPAHE